MLGVMEVSYMLLAGQVQASWSHLLSPVSPLPPLSLPRFLGVMTSCGCVQMLGFMEHPYMLLAGKTHAFWSHVLKSWDQSVPHDCVSALLLQAGESSKTYPQCGIL
jgi:hypothetical protein